jgi:competence protein ComEA
VRATAMAFALGLSGLAVLGPSDAWAVNVNQATAQQLQAVKGIGAKTAERIVAERARGPFESLEHLAERLSGIGAKTIVRLKAAGLCTATATDPCTSAPQPSQTGGAQSRSSGEVVTPVLIRLP